MRVSCLSILCSAGCMAAAAPPTYVITDTGEESDGPAAPFDRLDRDGDGLLSETEAPPPPSGRTR